MISTFMGRSVREEERMMGRVTKGRSRGSWANRGRRRGRREGRKGDFVR